MRTTDLSTFNNEWFKPGPRLRRFAWYFTNIIFFKSSIFPVYSIKRGLLRVFGASISRGVLVKPCVNIKYPWLLTVGENTWIGENVWIDNLAEVKIGANVCLSQGAFLLTGNHNYQLPSFDLMVKGIVLEDGVWIGAGSIVCPGITCHSHSVLSVASVATSNLEPYSIYRGNPAEKIKTREIQ